MYGHVVVGATWDIREDIMMRTLSVSLVVALAGAWVGGAALALESHYLPPDTWPTTVLPGYVSAQPGEWSEELSAPILEEAVRPRVIMPDSAEAKELEEVINDEGKRDATCVADMCRRPARVADLARSGDYQTAAELGQATLKMNRKAFFDFTWDYVGNAAAQSLLQLGRYEEAAEAHEAAAQRIDDSPLTQYHRMVAQVIRQVLEPPKEGESPAVKPEDLKSYATIETLLRQEILPKVNEVRRTLPMLGKGNVGFRLGRLSFIYPKLRLLQTVEPRTAAPLLEEMRTQLDLLATECADAVLTATQQQYAKVGELEKLAISESRSKQWNRELTRLWALISETKRLCRIHNYLARIGLTKGADAGSIFDQAHAMLFCPDDRNQVYKTCGGKVMGQTDLNRRGPYVRK